MKRSEADFYITPPYLVQRLFDGVELPGGRWLEPCAGDGQIIRVARTLTDTIRWSAAELREEMRPELEPLGCEHLRFGDFLGMSLEAFGGEKFQVAVTNPPFRLALPIIQKCMTMAHMTIMLLRVNFWGSEERHGFMAAHPPDCYVIPNRPIFTLNKEGKPGTDSIEYMWAVWQSFEHYEELRARNTPRRHGLIKVLQLTSAADRKEWTDHLRRLGNRAQT